MVPWAMTKVTQFRCSSKTSTPASLLPFDLTSKKGVIEACTELGIPEIDIYDGYLDDHSAPVSHNLSFKPRNSEELCDFTLSAIVGPLLIPALYASPMLTLSTF